MSTTQEKVKFYRGKSYNPTTQGDTESKGEIVFLNDRMKETPPAEEDALKQYNIERKLGSIWQDDKIVGTTRANELCLTNKIKVTKEGVTVGGITTNTVLDKGMSLEEILRQMFCETYNPEYSGPYTLNNINAVKNSVSAPSTTGSSEVYILVGSSTTLSIPTYMSNEVWTNYSNGFSITEASSIGAGDYINESATITSYTEDETSGNSTTITSNVTKYCTNPSYTTPEKPTTSTTRKQGLGTSQTPVDTFSTDTVILSSNTPDSATYKYIRTDAYSVTAPTEGKAYSVKWPTKDGSTYINESTYISTNSILDSDLNAAKRIESYPEGIQTANGSVTFTLPTNSNTYTYTYTVKSVLPVLWGNTKVPQTNYTKITNGDTEGILSDQITVNLKTPGSGFNSNNTYNVGSLKLYTQTSVDSITYSCPDAKDQTCVGTATQESTDGIYKVYKIELSNFNLATAAGTDYSLTIKFK